MQANEERGQHEKVKEMKDQYKKLRNKSFIRGAKKLKK